MNLLESGLRCNWDPNTGFKVPEAKLPEMTPQRIGNMLGIIFPAFIMGCRAFGASVDSTEATAAADIVQTVQAMYQATAEAVATPTLAAQASELVGDYLQVTVRDGQSILEAIQDELANQFGNPFHYDRGYSLLAKLPEGLQITIHGPNGLGIEGLRGIQELVFTHAATLPEPILQAFAGTPEGTILNIGSSRDMPKIFPDMAQYPNMCAITIDEVKLGLQELQVHCAGDKVLRFSRGYSGGLYTPWAPVSP